MEQGQMRFEGLRALVGEMLTHAHALPWTIQGLGMLRLHLGDGAMRLHIWDPRMAVPNVSALHNHPWDFTSLVLAGELTNRIYRQFGGGRAYHTVRIRCGEGGGPLRPVCFDRLQLSEELTYRPGQAYSQTHEEIHQTLAAPGTVTLVHRTSSLDCEDADVYWLDGPWVSAEPRKATQLEIAKFAWAAQEAFGQVY